MSHGDSTSVAVTKPTSKPIRTLTKTNVLAGIILIIISTIRVLSQSEEPTVMLDTLSLLFIISIVLFTCVQGILLVITCITRKWESVKHALIGIIISVIFLAIIWAIDNSAF